MVYIHIEIEKYKDLGYTEEHIFPGEYVLLLDPKTLHKVRIYENGSVWVSDKLTGKYNKEKTVRSRIKENLYIS